MTEKLKDILSRLSSDVDQETLLLYLQNKLSEAQKHEVEKKLLKDEFNEDAFEGLQQFSDKEQLQHITEMLNRDLKQKIAKRKKRTATLPFKDQPWLYYSILILLLLIVISYIVISRLLKQGY